MQEATNPEIQESQHAANACSERTSAFGRRPGATHPEVERHARCYCHVPVRKVVDTAGQEEYEAIHLWRLSCFQF